MPNKADIHVSFFQMNSGDRIRSCGNPAKKCYGNVNDSQNVVKQTPFTMQMHRMVAQN